MVVRERKKIELIILKGSLYRHKHALIKLFKKKLKTSSVSVCIQCRDSNINFLERHS